MAPINPLRAQISIKEWDLKESQKGPRQDVFRHLDLGSANYNSSDSKIHRVLFSNVDRVIAEHPDYKKFVFYLNDISSDGLNRAALNLSHHLEETYQDKDIKVKIVKIVKSFFDFDPIPSINSATLLNPENSPFRTIANLSGRDFHLLEEYHYFNNWLAAETESFIPLWKSSKFLDEAKKIVDLFQRVASASKEGLLVKEINVRHKEAVKINEKLSTPEGMSIFSLHFVNAEEKTKSISPYIFHSGRDISSIGPRRGSVSYLVTQAIESTVNPSSHLANSETSQSDESILAALKTELKKAEQECYGYETEGTESFPWHNRVLIRSSSGDERLVKGRLVETVGRAARDDQGEIIPNRVITHDNQVHHGKVLEYQLDSQDRPLVRLFDRVFVYGDWQNYQSIARTEAAFKDARMECGMKNARKEAQQKMIATRERVADLETQIAGLEKKSV